MNDQIVIQNLSKSFRADGGERTVLKQMDLTVPAHEITVILGPSGCGKTTLLRLIGGLDKAYHGKIETPPHSRTAFVFQEPRLMPWLTARENIAFGLSKKEQDPQKIDALLHLTGLDGFGDAYPSQLSGGMSQRCALARALALDPDYIMMDEPFAALDHFTREKMQLVLLDIHRQNRCGVLFVTHSIDEALRIGDRIVVMGDHKVRKEFPLSPRPEGGRDLSGLQELKAEILKTIQTI